MDKGVLSAAVAEGLTQRELAERFGVGQTAIRYWLVKHELKTVKQFLCKCGETDPSNFTKGRYTSCKKCRNRQQTALFRKYKLKAIEYKGGKCEMCNYNRCPGAMDFHHIDPKEKDVRWKQMRTWTFSKIKKELDKCQLLCCRCHAEVHWKQD